MRWLRRAALGTGEIASPYRPKFVFAALTFHETDRELLRHDFRLSRHPAVPFETPRHTIDLLHWSATRAVRPYSNRVVRLLCTRDQRPCYRAAEQDIEPTPVNWMCRHLLAPGKQPTSWKELITLAEYVRYWHLADIPSCTALCPLSGVEGT